MSVKEAKQRIDSAEFTDWLAFASHEPIGQDRNDLLAAMIRSDLDAGFYLVAKSNGASFSAPKQWRGPSDLVPKWWEQAERREATKHVQTVEEQAMILDMYFGSMGIKKT